MSSRAGSTTSGGDFSTHSQIDVEKAGYLQKWTNYLKGYRSRWFVLDADSVLSYYRFVSTRNWTETSVKYDNEAGCMVTILLEKGVCEYCNQTNDCLEFSAETRWCQTLYSLISSGT